MINEIKLEGTIKEIIGDYAINNIKYRRYLVSVDRLSGAIDELPVVKRVSADTDFKIGDNVSITGELRTRNVKVDETKTRLDIYVQAMTMDHIEEALTLTVNQCTFEGFICRQPGLRVTPLNKTVCDLTIAISNPNGHSYYIPVVCFNSVARAADKLAIADKILLHGRFQSRPYTKTIDNKTVTKVAYEVIGSKLEKITEEVNNKEV